MHDVDHISEVLTQLDTSLSCPVVMATLDRSCAKTVHLTEVAQAMQKVLTTGHQIADLAYYHCHCRVFLFSESRETEAPLY